ncbi:MAG: long-chain-fatty-acid--CoA ligase [Steroidobacteraceae bacterium]|nr:long-chain-fatty-acid--CoA ligase [Steroidobacteraceae bacterium]MBP7012282.1 long-chain-fatty-acid--CoA ligase [Steroidobacteraceae bacterium]
MERFWLKHYPPGVPHDVDLTQYSSLVDLIDKSFREHASRNAYAYMDRFFTFGEIDRYSAAFASWLQSQGLARGARVAIMMPNVVQYPIALAGVLRAGHVVVNVNPLYTPRELEHQLKDSGAEAIVILENFAATLQQVIARTAVKQVIIASLGEMLGFPKGAIVNFAVRRLKKMVPGYSLPGHVRFTEALDAGARRKLEPVAATQRDIAFLQYTGGTTGVSKGAALTHGNLVANVLQMEAWIVPALQDTSRGPVPSQFVYICALPLYHVFALVVNCLFGMRIGTLNVLIPNPRDIAGFVKELGKYKFNVLPGVNTLYNALLQNEEFRKLDFSSLRVANGGGMAVQKATSEKWLALTGVPIIEGYGLSETSPVATCNPILNREYNGTIGLPFPNTEIQILDDAGQVVPLGQPGEIAIRGPQVMAGYWNRPDETAKVMTPDGFFKSGDIGIMDERGYIRIVDRKKDMILVSGFNVYPNEIEQVITTHPGVVECAAIGVPDDKSGEAVKVFVVRKDPALTVEQLMEFCKENFTGYKKPKYIEFRDELPKSNVGKILRRELRDAAVAAGQTRSA